MTDLTFNFAGLRKRKFIDCPDEDVPNWDPTEHLASGYEDFYKPQGSIELRIDRFTEFAEGNGMKSKRWSALTFIRGLPWLIAAYPKEIDTTDGQNEQTKYLTLYFCCKNESTNTEWNIQATGVYRVVSQKEGVDYCKRGSANKFGAEDNKLGCARFITIQKLLDPQNGFIKDDTVIVQVDVTAEVPHGIQKDHDTRRKAYKDIFGTADKSLPFSLSTDYPWDFVLAIQDKKVHVQKNLMSLHSEYFKKKFAEDGDSESAILQNIDYDEFIELLRVIYPTLCPITVTNVETVAKLAYIFKMKGVLRQCEAVLMVKNYKFGRIRTFLLSHWYGMEHLQAKCIEELKAISDLKQLRKELEFAALDCRTKAILLDKIIENSPNKSLAELSTTKNMESSDQESASNNRALEISDRFASSAIAHSDGVLIVENNRISIHKMHLALYSKYFNTLFLGEFKENNQDEIELEEVSYTDILELLAVIYPCNYPVTDEKLEVILKLADRFIMPEILERCKKALKRSQKIKRSLKLYLAQRYHFPDLQIEYAKEYKNVDDVENLKAEPEYESLDDETRSLIFDSITS